MLPPLPSVQRGGQQPGGPGGCGVALGAQGRIAALSRNDGVVVATGCSLAGGCSIFAAVCSLSLCYWSLLVVFASGCLLKQPLCWWLLASGFLLVPACSVAARSVSACSVAALSVAARSVCFLVAACSVAARSGIRARRARRQHLLLSATGRHSQATTYYVTYPRHMLPSSSKHVE